MSRYIDADALIAKMPTAMDMQDTYLPIHFKEWLIDTAPSIDIVRCKECKHNPWNIDTDYTCIWDDDFADREQTPDDFCSYGDREGE